MPYCNHGFDQRSIEWLTKFRGLTTTKRAVTFGNTTVSAAPFPIGIDPEKFHTSLESEPVQRRIAELEEEFKDKRVMVGVDRLDYVKGIPEKLRAFELFLEEHPECIGSMVFIQVAVPTRGEVEQYQNLRTLVNEMIGRINGRFGDSPLIRKVILSIFTTH